MPSFFPLPTFHTSPLQLCIHTVHSRVIDVLSFVASQGATVSALIFHHTLHSYPSLIPVGTEARQCCSAPEPQNSFGTGSLVFLWQATAMPV